MVNIKKKGREEIQQAGEPGKGKSRKEAERIKRIVVTTHLVISLNYFKRLFQVKERSDFISV